MDVTWISHCSSRPPCLSQVAAATLRPESDFAAVPAYRRSRRPAPTAMAPPLAHSAASSPPRLVGGREGRGHRRRPPRLPRPQTRSPPRRGTLWHYRRHAMRKLLPNACHLCLRRRRYHLRRPHRRRRASRCQHRQPRRND